MKASEILALSMSGYNSQQISVLAQEVEKEAAAPAPVKTTSSEQTAPAPAPAPDPTPSQNTQSNDFSTLLERLDKLQSAIQNGNIMSMQQPEQHTQTPEEILASIINPPIQG